MVTELRVHGVSGSPAESMLDRPLVHRVAGDNDASFSRPRPDYGAATGPGGVQLEAYRWGNLTAGAAARAMWLLLLPFMLANVAIWLRPPAGRRGTLLTAALCRLFALGITAMFVLSLVGVSLDLVAWQCAKPGSSCGARRTYLSFLTSGFFSPTGRRLAVLALVPIVAVALLWLLARRTWSRYEAFPVSQAAGGDGLAAAGSGPARRRSGGCAPSTSRPRSARSPPCSSARLPGATGAGPGTYSPASPPRCSPPASSPSAYHG